MSILLADDDVHLATFLSKSLESEGYSVHTALDEGTVLSELQRQNYKLIILDLNFGETDGLKLLQKLRSGGLETPVMVLSARNRISDRIESLNLGADDYITKPFSFQELAARANALLRRKADPSLSVLRVENLELDPASRKVHRGRHEAKLSPKEFELLFLLMRYAGETVSRHDLLRESWGLELESDSNLVDVYVNYLRKKIDLPGEEKLIHTVRGAGYRIGRPAPLQGAGRLAKVSLDAGKEGVYNHAVFGDSQGSTVQVAQVRALIHSLAHDLAQPLTSVRCFLEVIGLHDGAAAISPNDLKNIEQQADRAISLARGISALARELPMPLVPGISLDLLLDDVFNDFVVLLHSGLLTAERRLNPAIQVTSQAAVACRNRGGSRRLLRAGVEVESQRSIARPGAGRKKHSLQGPSARRRVGPFHWWRAVIERRAAGNPGEAPCRATRLAWPAGFAELAAGFSEIPKRSEGSL
jgi:two-component system OmpR family response regulator